MPSRVSAEAPLTALLRSEHAQTVHAMLANADKFRCHVRQPRPYLGAVSRTDSAFQRAPFKGLRMVWAHDQIPG